MTERVLVFKGKLKIIFSDTYFLLTLLVCVVLFGLKFQDFYIPYFSDELWVYGPSVRKLSEIGPSLLPNVFGVEDHWGHPMLFFFLGSFWSTLFGSSVFSTHFFSATISITFLISTYFIAKSFFSKKIGFYSVLLIACQSIFIGQFSLVLPEVLLTLFTLFTFYNYQRGNTYLYLLSGVCLVLTKETGILPILSIIVWDFMKTVLYDKEKSPFIIYVKNYLWLGLPLLAIVFHVAFLKITYGWFIMPIRVEHFEFSWDLYRTRVMKNFHYVFIGQGREPIAILMFFIVILMKKNYSIWFRLLILTLVYSMIKIFYKYWDLPNIISMAFIPILYVLMLKILFWDIYKKDKKRGGIIALFSIFITVHLLFSATQFDSLRYLLCTIPLYIIIGAYFIDASFSKQKYLLPLLSIIIISFSFYYISNDKNYGDDTVYYTNECKIRENAVFFLEKNISYETIIHSSFLYNHALTRPLTGYLKSDKWFTKVHGLSNDNNLACKNCIFIFEENKASIIYKKVKEDNTFDLIYQEEKDRIWVEIYAKKQQL